MPKHISVPYAHQVDEPAVRVGLPYGRTLWAFFDKFIEYPSITYKDTIYMLVLLYFFKG